MEADKSRLYFGMTLGTTAATEDVEEKQSNSSESSAARMVPAGNRVSLASIRVTLAKSNRYSIQPTKFDPSGPWALSLVCF